MRTQMDPEFKTEVKKLGDCHIHVIMDGENYRNAVEKHREAVVDDVIHQCFLEYQGRGISFLRDGGDSYHVSERARELAPAYGITYRTPLFAIHKKGHYGGIVGYGFEHMSEYQALVDQVRRKNGDFIKIMVSGLIDFSKVGVLTEEGLDRDTIREMIRIAHEEGFSVMAHTNGVRNVLDVIEAGVDSLEHGAFMNEECIQALAESKTIWVPTLSPCQNMIGCGRFDDGVLREIAAIHMENIRMALERGAMLALGSDAGAWQVPHGKGTETELSWMQMAAPKAKQMMTALQEGEREIRRRFQRGGRERV
ncbi:amidohydrolase family protein [Hominifimenecus sp. rT4P-3]|uniref:amidohydrolase family protein n=1 Tax=Hominifimenecus sp. rT4P-3 TaxID=3242979 RepID=UPI003DA52A12